jgi:hypothetical protein
VKLLVLMTVLPIVLCDWQSVLVKYCPVLVRLIIVYVSLSSLDFAIIGCAGAVCGWLI